MISFMDYIVHAFGTSTNWNYDNSYSSLTATSDALLAFETPSTLALHVSSLSTPNFASSYTLSTLGQIDGSISYLYTTNPLSHIPSQTTSIPLRYLVRGYRNVKLPILHDQDLVTPLAFPGLNERKPTLLFATLALPPPSTLTALYARRLDPKTLLSFSLHSKSASVSIPSSGPPPASILAHIQHDTGKYSIEGLGSTDSALLGFRGLWNFGLSPPKPEQANTNQVTDFIEDSESIVLPSKPSPILSYEDSVAAFRNRLASKPSLLSAGAEFYYSPYSHVIGLSTGLRFTTLAPHITPNESSSETPSTGPKRSYKPRAGTSATLSQAFLAPSNVTHSSFPYTMTLTLTPLTGSIASTYSVRPTPNLALSSRCDFNFYSWESKYIVGAEIWRPRRQRRKVASASRVNASSDNETETEWEEEDPIAWARERTSDWFSPQERQLKEETLEREEENGLKLRLDDSWNFGALWTGRVKALLVSAGVSFSPVARVHGRSQLDIDDADGGAIKRKWTGSVGVSVAYST